jgi:hypothetical protein
MKKIILCVWFLLFVAVLSVLILGANLMFTC